jgi:hypothetical protein
MGREKGGTNKEGHRAGGARPNSGPKPKSKQPTIRLFTWNNTIESGLTSFGAHNSIHPDAIIIDEINPEDSSDVHEDAELDQGDVEDEKAPLNKTGRHWKLKMYFDELQDVFQNEIGKNGKNPVGLLKKGYFWSVPGDPVASNSSLISPWQFLYPKVFLWFPLLCLSDFKLKCPTCQGLETEVHGWAVPRRVVAMTEVYYVMSRRFKCRACEKERNGHPENKVKYTFSSYDPYVLATLPRFISSKFPACFSSRSGLDGEVVNSMRSLFDKGISPKQMESLIWENHYRKYHESMRTYLDMCRYKRKNGGSVFTKWPPERFPSFKDVFGILPRSGYLKDMYCKNSSRLKEYQDAAMSQTSVRILKPDESFKIPKYMCTVSNNKGFEALYTACAEDESVRLQKFCV